MDGVISNGVFVDEDRPGWATDCPYCNKGMKFTKLKVWSGCKPFLYCNICSNFVLRSEDEEMASDIAYNNIDAIDNSIIAMRKMYAELEEILLPCECGGRFTLWANVKCPHCMHEIPYNHGIKSEGIRFYDDSIIWVEGASLYRGSQRPSSRLIHVRT